MHPTVTPLDFPSAIPRSRTSHFKGLGQPEVDLDEGVLGTCSQCVMDMGTWLAKKHAEVAGMEGRRCILQHSPHVAQLEVARDPVVVQLACMKEERMGILEPCAGKGETVGGQGRREKGTGKWKDTDKFWQPARMDTID